MLFHQTHVHKFFSALVAFDILGFDVNPLGVGPQVEDLGEEFSADLACDGLVQVVNVTSVLGEVIFLFERFVAVAAFVELRKTSKFVRFYDTCK